MGNWYIPEDYVFPDQGPVEVKVEDDADSDDDNNDDDGTSGQIPPLSSADIAATSSSTENDDEDYFSAREIGNPRMRLQSPRSSTTISPTPPANLPSPPRRSPRKWQNAFNDPDPNPSQRQRSKEGRGNRMGLFKGVYGK